VRKSYLSRFGESHVEELSGHPLFIDEPKVGGRLSLDFDKYVRSIANLIITSDPQFTIGIFGNWGTGKSTILTNIKRTLEKEYSISCAVFNAWQYEQETAQMAIPMILSILAELYRQNQKQIDALDRSTGIKDKLNRVFSGLSLNLKFGIPGLTDLELGYDFSKLGEQSGPFKFLTTKKKIERFSLEQTKIQEGIDIIRQLIQNGELKGAGKNGKLKLVVFIDDLDRCTPEKAAEIFEVVKVFLSIEGIVYVLGLSNKIIELAIEKKYEHLQGQFKGSEYLRKIIQLQFSIPSLSLDDVAGYIEDLLNEYTDKEYGRFFRENRDLIGLGIEPNPREIKRQLNNFILSYDIARSVQEKIALYKKEFLAFNILSRRWEWFFDAYLTDPQFPSMVKETIERRLKSEKGEHLLIDRLFEDKALFDFLKGVGGKTIFSIRAEILPIFKSTRYAIELVTSQVDSDKPIKEEIEGRDYSHLISEFRHLSETELRQVSRLIKTDPKFATNLGFSIGSYITDLDEARRSFVFSEANYSHEFAKGLGASLGREFNALDITMQKKVTELVTKNEEFANAFASALGNELLSPVSDESKQMILMLVRDYRTFASALARSFESDFTSTNFVSFDIELQGFVWSLASESIVFARILGESLGKSFNTFSEKQKALLYEKAEAITGFAEGLGLSLGEDLGSVSQESVHKILDLAKKIRPFARTLSIALERNFKGLSPSLQIQIIRTVLTDKELTIDFASIIDEQSIDKEIHKAIDGHDFEYALMLLDKVQETGDELVKAILPSLTKTIEAEILLKPDDARLWVFKAMCDIIMGRYFEAMKSLDEALTRDPRFAPAFLYKGRIKASVGGYVDAITYCEDALKYQDLLSARERELLTDSMKYLQAVRYWGIYDKRMRDISYPEADPYANPFALRHLGLHYKRPSALV